MADYNVWADLFDTWQSMADWVKALAILTPPTSATAMLALLLQYRLAARRETPRPVPADLLPLPADPPVPIETDILDADRDLQFRLEEARQRLLPSSRSALDRAEVRDRIEEIIREEFYRGSEPGEALERVRAFLRGENG